MKLIQNVVLVLALPSFIQATLDCRPPGPVVPRPHNVSHQSLFMRATEYLTNALKEAIDGKIEAGWPVENTSFSIGIVTLDQPEKAIPAWEYHYLAQNNVNGTQNLTRDSQYLIGSISKVLSDYILLRSGVDPDAPVSQYLPKLNNTSKIHWKDVTLRQLGSHLAGIPANCKLILMKLELELT